MKFRGVPGGGFGYSIPSQHFNEFRKKVFLNTFLNKYILIHAHKNIEPPPLPRKNV